MSVWDHIFRMSTSPGHHGCTAGRRLLRGLVAQLLSSRLWESTGCASAANDGALADCDANSTATVGMVEGNGLGEGDQGRKLLREFELGHLPLSASMKQAGEETPCKLMSTLLMNVNLLNTCSRLRVHDPS